MWQEYAWKLGEYFSLYDGSIYYGNTDSATLGHASGALRVIGIVEQEPAILQDISVEHPDASVQQDAQ